MQNGEQALRRKLGIPPHAPHALIFAESSHWDPNWIYTSAEYYRYVQRNLDLAVQELLRDPRRIYSLESVFFLRMYWERNPAQQENVRLLVNQGRLRLTSSGVTTADTLIPSSEVILRDFLLGQEWLYSQGMRVEPQVAYFPDSFGCSHALPSLLNAAGFDRTALTRIDGMYFFGSESSPPARFPWRGSSAEHLMKAERTLDFVWVDGGGGEVLCHWNAFTYGQGDLLAFAGISRVYLAYSVIPLRTAGHVARRIRGYIRQLKPLARTPYMFCPIGFDFVAPIPDLVALLDRYNQQHYPETGVWAVNAGIDDYLELVSYHRERLPVLEMDPNPYWTGFYSARPSLKQQCHRLAAALQTAETLALFAENAVARGAALSELEDAWWKCVSSNHHDFITGTASDHVVAEEQLPWLQQGLAKAVAVIARLEPAVARPAAPQAEPPQWQQRGDALEIITPHYALELSQALGGCITRAWQPDSGQTLLDGPSADLAVYEDWGGLWRMGHEFTGGRLREILRASRRPARLTLRPLEGALEVSCTTRLERMELTRRFTFRRDSPLVGLEVEGMAAEGRTVTLRLATGIPAETLSMDEPGGNVTRPALKRYDPTFWPAQSFIYLHHGDQSMAVLAERMSAVALRPRGLLELVTHRNANQERFLGLIPFPGLPVRGRERAPHIARFALWPAAPGDWQTQRPLLFEEQRRFSALAGAWVTLDRPEVQVIALKPAARGAGIIVRLYAPQMQGQAVQLTFKRPGLRSAWLCDARERNLAPLELHAATVRLVMPGAFASIRVET